VGKKERRGEGGEGGQREGGETERITRARKKGGKKRLKETLGRRGSHSPIEHTISWHAPAFFVYSPHPAPGHRLQYFRFHASDAGSSGRSECACRQVWPGCQAAEQVKQDISKLELSVTCAIGALQLVPPARGNAYVAHRGDATGAGIPLVLGELGDWSGVLGRPLVADDAFDVHEPSPSYQLAAFLPLPPKYNLTIL